MTPVALYTAEQTRELDRLAIHEFNIPGYTLMQRAAAAAFRALRLRWPSAKSIAVFCGPGNNGGDGYVLARMALDSGLQCQLFALGNVQGISGDALQARKAWLDAGGRDLESAADVIAGSDVLVDALLGTGLTRDLSPEFADLVTAINTSDKPVLALDISTGLNGDTGAVMGGAIRATMTVTFIGRKRGLYTYQGPDHAGQIVFDDLNVPENIFKRQASSIQLLTDFESLGSRLQASHKGSYGRLLVVGGDHGMLGAVRLAGEAALRAGAGAVSIATHPCHCAEIAAVRPELMAHGVTNDKALQPLLVKAEVIVVGPGLGTSVWSKSLLASVLATAKPLVLDADALNLLAQQPRHLENAVLTPHAGEAGRLLQIDTAEVQEDRFGAVQALQEKYRAVSVLKGNGTLIAAENTEIKLINRGTPALAIPGSGDVLSGVIGGLIAQGHSLEMAAVIAALVHAQAGERASGGRTRGLLAADLMTSIASLINRH